MSQQAQEVVWKWVQIFLPALLSAIATVAVLKTQVAGLEISVGKIELAQTEISRSLQSVTNNTTRYDERIQSLREEVSDLRRRQERDALLSRDDIRSIREAMAREGINVN